MRPIIALATLFLGATGCIRTVPVPAEVPVDLNSTCPQVLRFTANPPIIWPGAEVLLSWSVRSAPDVTIEESTASSNTANLGEYLHVIGVFPASGTLRVSPKVATTYVISSGNEIIGCASASVSVVMKQPR